LTATLLTKVTAVSTVCVALDAGESNNCSGREIHRWTLGF